MIKIKQVGDIDGVATIEEWSGFCKLSLKNINAKKKSFKLN